MKASFIKTLVLNWEDFGQSIKLLSTFIKNTLTLIVNCLLIVQKYSKCFSNTIINIV